MDKCNKCLNEEFETLSTRFKKVEGDLYKEVTLVKCTNCENEYEIITNKELYDSVVL